MSSERENKTRPVQIYDARECPWWKPQTIGLVNKPIDNVQQILIAGLLGNLTSQGHTFLETTSLQSAEQINIMFAFDKISQDPTIPLVEQIPERGLPLALALRREYQLPTSPNHLITITTIPGKLSDRTHADVVKIARTFMARRGTPKVIFITGNNETSTIDEITLCTLEGGHPSISGDINTVVREVGNRVVAWACAEDVGHKIITSADVIPKDDYETSPIPYALIAAGQRMGQLYLLPPPINVGKYVSGRLAEIFQRYLSIQRFSEGMFAAWDTHLKKMIVTGTGSKGVDKRDLKMDQLAVASNIDKDGNLVIDKVEGYNRIAPSVEGVEVFACLKHNPSVAAIMHCHVGINGVDENQVEVIPLNDKLFPYPFCCGTDKNQDVSLDALARSQAINNPDDRRGVVIWELINHGIMVAELIKPEINMSPLRHALDLFENGAISYDPVHITQR